MIDWLIPQSFTLLAIGVFSVATISRMIIVFAIGYGLLYWAVDQSKPVRKFIKPFLYIIFAFGGAYDIFIQYTVASLIWLQLPPKNKRGKRTHFVTGRMQHYLAGPDTWRKTQARFWCGILERFDPGHCTGTSRNAFALLKGL